MLSKNFIYTLETSFLFRQCRHPLVFDAGNPFCLEPKTDLLPIPELRWVAAMSSHPDACFSPLPPSSHETECLGLVLYLEA